MTKIEAYRTALEDIRTYSADPSAQLIEETNIAIANATKLGKAAGVEEVDYWFDIAASLGDYYCFVPLHGVAVLLSNPIKLRMIRGADGRIDSVAA